MSWWSGVIGVVSICFNAYLLSRALGSSLNSNRVQSIGVFLFFVPKFILNSSQKRGANGKRTQIVKIRTDMSDGDRDRDRDRDREEDFYILRKSWCPAVLTENFFMDNHSDLEYLQSRFGKQAVVDTHVEGIVEWLESSKS